MSNHLVDEGPDVYCHRLARVDALGPNRRLVFTLPSATDQGWETVVMKIIMPADAAMALVRMIAQTDLATAPIELVNLECAVAN